MTGPEHTAEHARSVRSDSFYADLRRGVRYAFARRRKALTALAALAAMLLAHQLVSGNAALVCSFVILAAGGKAVDLVPNRKPVATGPRPSERATERGLPAHGSPDA